MANHLKEETYESSKNVHLYIPVILRVTEEFTTLRECNKTIALKDVGTSYFQTEMATYGVFQNPVVNTEST